MKILSNLKNNFCVDLRSLALTRIAFSILILFDLGIRSRYIQDFFTDAGVLPLKALRLYNPSHYRNSAHALSGEYGFELMLFILAAVFAILLLMGLFTRIATIVSWALLVSLNLRNPLLLQGGDTLFKCLMFWAIFTPWGERFSVDSYLKKYKESRNFVFSAGGMAFILQIMFLYFFSATLKTGDVWIKEYSAVYYSLSIDHFRHLLGPYLYQFPFILKVMTISVFWLELLGPFLLLIPFRNNLFRTVFIVIFASLQLGLAFTLRLGLFPWFSIMALLILVPSGFWDFFPRLEEKLNSLYSKISSIVKGLYGDIGNLLYFTLKWPRFLSTICTIFISLLLVYVLLWNLHHTFKSSFVFIEKVNFIGKAFQVNQKWNMFAPQPYKNDGWYVIVGRLRDGKIVDVFRGGKEVSWEPPANFHDDYPSYRWRKFMRNLYKAKNKKYLKYYSAYVCNKWNNTGNRTDLLEIDIYFVIQTNLPDYKVKDSRIVKKFGYQCQQTKKNDI